MISILRFNDALEVWVGSKVFMVCHDLSNYESVLNIVCSYFSKKQEEINFETVACDYCECR